MAVFSVSFLVSFLSKHLPFLCKSIVIFHAFVWGELSTSSLQNLFVGKHQGLSCIVRRRSASEQQKLSLPVVRCLLLASLSLLPWDACLLTLSFFFLGFFVCLIRTKVCQSYMLWKQKCTDQSCVYISNFDALVPNVADSSFLWRNTFCFSLPVVSW